MVAFNKSEVVELVTSCVSCGAEKRIVVDMADYEDWRAGGLIQNCFPYLSADDREILISRICGECFDRTFGGDE